MRLHTRASDTKIATGEQRNGKLIAFRPLRRTLERRHSEKMVARIMGMLLVDKCCGCELAPGCFRWDQKGSSFLSRDEASPYSTPLQCRPFLLHFLELNDTVDLSSRHSPNAVDWSSYCLPAAPNEKLRAEYSRSQKPKPQMLGPRGLRPSLL